MKYFEKLTEIVLKEILEFHRQKFYWREFWNFRKIDENFGTSEEKIQNLENFPLTNRFKRSINSPKGHSIGCPVFLQ